MRESKPGSISVWAVTVWLTGTLTLYQRLLPLTTKLPPEIDSGPGPEQVVRPESMVAFVMSPMVLEGTAIGMASAQKSPGRITVVVRENAPPLPMPLSDTRMRRLWPLVTGRLRHDAEPPQGVPEQSSLQLTSGPPQVLKSASAVSIDEPHVLTTSVPVVPAVKAYHTSREAGPPGSQAEAPSFVAATVVPAKVPLPMASALAQ